MSAVSYEVQNKYKIFQTEWVGVGWEGVRLPLRRNKSSNEKCLPVPLEVHLAKGIFVIREWPIFFLMNRDFIRSRESWFFQTNSPWNESCWVLLYIWDLEGLDMLRTPPWSGGLRNDKRVVLGMRLFSQTRYRGIFVSNNCPIYIISGLVFDGATK